MSKKIMKPNKKTPKDTGAGSDKPASVPEGAARSASYVISVAVHALVLLIIFFSAQFITSSPTPEPQKKYEEVLLQFDMGVPGAEGTSVMETMNPDIDSSVDNPDQGKPEVIETPSVPEQPKPETRQQTDPTPAQPKPQTTPHPNPAHQPEPATDNPVKPNPNPNTADNPWQPDNTGGADSNTTPGNPDNTGNPSHGTNPDPTGRPSLPGSIPAQSGWCRTKDDQNNPSATYSYKGGSYRCNCTLGQNVTCYLVN